MEFVALKKANIVNSMESGSEFHNTNSTHNPQGTSGKIESKVRRKCGEVFIDEDNLFDFLCTLCEVSFEEIEKFFVHVKGVHTKGFKCITIKEEDPLGPSDDDESRTVEHEPNVQITTIDDAEVQLPEYSEGTIDWLNTYSNINSNEHEDENKGSTDEEEGRTPYNMRRRGLKNELNRNQEYESDEDKDKDECENKDNFNKKDPTFDIDNKTVATKKIKLIKKCETKPVCEICGKSFASSRNLKKHKKRVNCSLIISTKPFICESCGTYFASKKSLQRHLRRRICEHFKKAETETETETDTIIKIEDNVSKENDNEPTKSANKTSDNVSDENKIDPKKCKYCDRLFSEARRRIEHERIHTGEKPYQCRFCGKLFRVHSHVCVHEKTHTVVEQYKCELCNITFKNKLCLQAHKKRHGEKKFPCEYCDMSFFNTRELRDHVRTHTGEKRYKCNLCEKSFISSGSFNYHKKKHSAWIHIVKE